MQVIKLGEGVHRLPKITEPTHLLSTVGWNAILEPQLNSNHAIVSTAPLRITGFQVRNAPKCGIQVYSEGGPCPLEVENLWVHNNARHGINTADGPIRGNNLLVEYNGTNRQYHHGIYGGKGDIWITNSILYHNSSSQLCSCESGNNVVVDQCLLVGPWAAFITNCKTEDLLLRRNTLQGELTLHTGNLTSPEHVISPDNIIIGNGEGQISPSKLVDMKRRLYWPNTDIPEGAGCYDAHPCTIEYAKTLWHEGYMFAYDGWDYADNHFYHPHFPGEPIPEILNT